jgi:erythromycin esterase-like protein
VAADDDWDGDMEIKRVNPSRSDSVERIFHDAGVARRLLDQSSDNPATRALRPCRLERFIRVIYRTATELQSHYAEASLARQFDALLWFDEMTAAVPLAPAHANPGLPDTYPFGL